MGPAAAMAEGLAHTGILNGEDPYLENKQIWNYVGISIQRQVVEVLNSLRLCYFGYVEHLRSFNLFFLFF